MPTARAYFILVTYGDAIYALGGYNDGGELSNMERYSRGLGWQTVASLPYTNHRSAFIITIMIHKEGKTWFLALKLFCKMNEYRPLNINLLTYI